MIYAKCFRQLLRHIKIAAPEAPLSTLTSLP